MSGLKWVQVETTFLTGPTLRRIARTLGVSRQQMVGMFTDLWAWAQEHAPDGKVSGPDAAELIEEAAEWTGERGAFVGAVFSVGEEDSPFQGMPGDGVRIRGMDRYARALHKRMKEAERKRAERASGLRPQDISRTGDGRPQDVLNLSAGQVTDKERTGDGRPQDVRAPSVSPSLSTSSSVVSKGGVGGDAGAPTLVERMLSAWFAVRGYALDYQPHRDEPVLRTLGDKHGRDEVEKRWGYALTYTRFPEVGGFADLRKHWDRYGKPEAAPTSKPTGTLASQDYTEGPVPGWGRAKTGGAP